MGVRDIIRLAAWLGLLVALLGCSLQQGADDESGSDGEKKGARELPLGRMDMDVVDPEEGDQTDWRYFRIPATGVIDLSISFDNHSAGGVLIVRDMLGAQRARLQHRGQPVLKASFRGEPGVYYVEIFAQKARTDYTIQIDYETLF